MGEKCEVLPKKSKNRGQEAGIAEYQLGKTLTAKTNQVHAFGPYCQVILRVPGESSAFVRRRDGFIDQEGSR